MFFEFLNYKKYKSENQRVTFSSKIRSLGIGHIPIVIDSINKELSLAISTKDNTNTNYIKYGLEISIHMDSNILNIINIINEKMSANNTIIPFDLYIETNSDENFLINEKSVLNLGDLYKIYKNKEDNILYFLIQPKITLYENLLLSIQNIYNYIFKKILN